VITAAALALGGMALGAAPAAATPTDADFAGWTLDKGVTPSRDADASITQETSDVHSGAGALLVVNRTPVGDGKYIFLEQDLTVTPNTTYDIGAWAKSEGMPEAAFSGTLSPDWSERFWFPQGAFDWTHLTWTYTTKSDQTVLSLRLITEGITTGLLVDDLTIAAQGSSTNLLVNGGFDQAEWHLPQDARFDKWTLDRGTNTPRDAVASMSQSTDDVHSGEGALRVENRTEAGNSRYIFLEQVIPVATNTEYTITAWAKSYGFPQGAFTGTLSPDWSERIVFPTGAYDWQKLTWTYTTTATQTSIDLRLITEGITPELLVDDLSVTTTGSTTNLVANGGFDTLASSTTVNDSTLLFSPGEARLHVTSTLDSLDWSARGLDGALVASGTTAVVAGAATISLTSLPVGYYDIKLSATGFASIVTSIGVIEDAPQDSRLGVGLHIGAPGYDTATPDIVRLGFDGARFDANWQQIEQSTGQYTFPSGLDGRIQDLTNRGLTPLPIAAYNNSLYDGGDFPQSPTAIAAFAAFSAAVANHWAGDEAVEIYNEPNNPGITTGTSCRSDGGCFANLLNAAATKVRADAPGTEIVGPSLAFIDDGWLSALYQAGGLASLDAVSVHPYRESAPESIAADLQQVHARIRQYNSGVDKPLWLTELGWSTFTSGITETTQADYLTRAEAIALANGVEKFFWYDLLDDGTNASDREQRFGLFHQPTTQIAAAAPKPAAVAQAVFAAALDGRPYSSTEAVPGINSVVFGTGSNAMRTLWSLTPTSVAVSATSALTLTEQYGRTVTVTPVDGKVYLDLGTSPVYLTGGVSQIAVVSPSAVSISIPRVVGAGEGVPVTLTADRRGNVDLPTTVTFNVAGEEFPLTTVANAVATTTVSISGTSRRGGREVTGYVSGPSGALARVLASTTVGDVFEVSGTPNTNTVSPFSASFVALLANRSATPMSTDSIEWTVGSDSGTVGSVDVTAPGDEQAVDIPVPNATIWTEYPYTLTATLSNGTVLTSSGTTSFNPVEPQGESVAAPIDFVANGKPTYDRTYGGATDLSGTAQLAWSSAGLTVTAHVVDNVFSPPTNASTMYLDDSLQFAVSPGLPGTTSDRVEFGLALVDNSPSVVAFAAAPGQPSGVLTGTGATIIHSGTATDYQITVPWAQLGFSGVPTSDFAVSLLVNDDDADGHQRGFVEWGAGIAQGKSTAHMKTVQLMDLPLPRAREDRRSE
jgi:hypothetical protein